MPKILILAVAASVLSGAPHMLHGQAADHYRGAVVNSSLPSSPASLELAVFDRSDTLTVGLLTVGAPLGGSGLAVGFLRGGDSLLLVSMSRSGDTILWTSPSRSGSIGGSYAVRGGQYAGQSGQWQMQPMPAPSRLPLIGAAIATSVAITLAMLGIARAAKERWWRWRASTPLRPLPAQQRSSLTGVGGWLAWFVLGVIATVLYKIATLAGAVDNLGTGAWMIAAVIPGIRPVLFVESVFHFLQIVASLVGLTLLFRSARAAPVYWVVLLITFTAYGVYDLASGSVAVTLISQQFGGAIGKEVGQAISEASALNARLVIFSIVWSIYWIRSRRVRLSFGEVAQSPALQTAL